jgi:orotate phosphoribosyltransferase
MGTKPIDVDAPIAELLTETGALQEGHFLLSSGLHSDVYVQCALLLSHPPLAERVGGDLAERWQKAGAAVDVVIGPALGGVILAHEVARALGVRALFAERADGEMALRRGFAIGPGTRVLVVEDVITTGGSAREVGELCRAAGGVVVGYAALVERSADHGLAPCIALWQVRPRTYAQKDCPLCAAGSTPYKPGSRTRAGRPEVLH